MAPFPTSPSLPSFFPSAHLLLSLALFFLCMQSNHRMSKSGCERCRGRGFWDTDDQDTYFFKVMIGGFRRQMTIPYKFAENFRDQIQGTIKLKACNGNTCSVLVDKCSNKLVLTKGWAEFANSHDIKMGDFLVFRYIGNSQFEVKIFDPSGCVKASSHNAVNIGQHAQNMQGDPIEILSCSDEHLRAQSLTTERQNQPEKDVIENCNKKMKTEHASSSEDDQETPTAEVHRMKVEEMVRDIHSNHPVFVAVMKKSNVTRQPCYVVASEVLYQQTQIENAFKGVEKIHKRQRAAGAPLALLIALFFPPHFRKMKRCGQKMRKLNTRSTARDDQEKYFFKVMIGDFHKRMTIPDKFARHFKGVISKTIKLEPRSGYTFDVQVTKKLNILVFGSGWESFVNAHDLNMGDFLVFKYNGDFLLQVLIFDPSGCEKSTSCSMENAIDHVGQGWKEHNDISTSYHDQPKGNKHWMQKDSSSKGNKIGNTRSSNTPSKFSGCILPRGTCLPEVQEKKMKEKIQSIHSKTPMYGNVMTKCNVSGSPCVLEITQLYDDAYLPYNNGQELMLRHRDKSWKVRFYRFKNKSRKLTQASLLYKMRRPGARCREGHAHFNGNHIDGQDKNFFKVMIGRFRERMIIPNEFLQYFRGKIPRTIKLQLRDGCTYDVQVTKNLGKISLQSGWKAFVTAHDLQLGDFLVFSYDEISELKVLIFGPSGCEKVHPCPTTKGATHSGEKWEEPLRISSNSYDLPVKSPQSVSKSEKQWDSSGQENNTANIEEVALQGDDLQVHPVLNCILPKHTRLTDMQKQQLERKVRAIHSEIPIYGCILRKSRVHGKSQTVEPFSLCNQDICREYADVYLPFKELNMTLQRHGKNWEVLCHTKDTRTKRLSTGWSRFAQENNLQVGDICLFELLKNKEYSMNVHIIPKK
uniref:TF-B3 domain-containing protein n=1 Tax=Oryza meridionalis TaxID=40149 RepID=A0A0E0D3S2_9ORYZ